MKLCNLLTISAAGILLATLSATAQTNHSAKSQSASKPNRTFLNNSHPVADSHKLIKILDKAYSVDAKTCVVS